MADAGELVIFAGQFQQGIAGGHQRFVSVARVILQLHIKTGGAAQTADGRRTAGKDARFFNFVKRFGCAFDDGKR